MPQKQRQKGFSIIELLMVIAIIAVLAIFTVMSLGFEEAYAADERGMTVLDYLKEARQRSITQREVMRVEINRDQGTVSLINENTAGDADDDEVIRTATLVGADGVVFDRAPQNMDAPPAEVAPVPVLQFNLSVHPHSAPDNVATLRFHPDGTVTDAGSNEVGDNATVTGATIYFWTPLQDGSSTPTNGDIVRAITVLGGSGNTNYLKCVRVGDTCTTWK
ncbi:MAG: type II secretion system protein [Acidobacteriota bacterium]|nr:MAG: type II secretion system protein [Acidobacteriota bacterium]